MASNDTAFSYFILGAGAPHTGDIPTALHETSVGKPVLDWLLEAYDTAIENVTFIAGYQAEDVKQRYPSLRVVDNAEWQETGSLYSLLVGQPDPTKPLFVSYGDVLFRKPLVDKLAASSAGVCVVYDSHWRSRPESDVREKLAVRDGVATRLGYDLPESWADGEFIGLVRFSADMVGKLCALASDLGEATRKMSLSDGVEYLRAQGEQIAAIDVDGDWVEVRASRDIAHFVLGTKAETLQRLRNLIQSATIQDQVTFCVKDWNRDPDQIRALVRKQLVTEPDTRLVVRSSSRSEDTFTSSNAGGFDSVLNVHPDTGLDDAVNQVIESYITPEDEDQVLVQPMLQDVVLSGVAFTRTLENQAPWYVINYEANGSTDGVTSGASSDHVTLHVRRGTDASQLPIPALADVLRAIEEVEQRLGFDALDIEFAVDSDGGVHVFQVRPIAAVPNSLGMDDSIFSDLIAHARTTWDRLEQTPPSIPGNQQPIYGVMPDWNPAEIIGTAPGALADTLYRFLIMDETWATQRFEYGYRDARPNPLLVSFAGRPYVDVRASFTSFIPAALDEDIAGRQLSFCLDWLRARPELHDKVEFDVIPTCLAPDFSFWEERLANEGNFSSDEIAQIRQALHGVTAQAFTRSDDDFAKIDMLEERHAKTMATVKDPLERARILLEDCRRYGTLPFSHLARSGFVASTLLRGAERMGAISTEAHNSFLSTIRTVSHSFTADAHNVAVNKMPWEDFVAKYGHLRPGTYDIASARYDADPETFLRPQTLQATEAAAHDIAPAAWEAERSRFFDTLAALDLPSDPELVERFMHQAIEGREYAKFIFSRSLSDAIEAIAEVGEAMGLSRDDLADLPLADILGLRDSQEPRATVTEELRQKAARNRLARDVSAAAKLPPLLTGANNFDVFEIGAEIANFVGQTPVVGECIDLEHTERGEVPNVKGRIALIPQADPGYDWLFGQGISGLVTMYGGANSHMTIRAAEFGLPAAIGIGEQRYREICNAKILQLDPAKQILQVVS
jgi:glutamine kinase